MTADFPATARRAFEHHDSFRPDGGAFLVETTVFDGRVTAVDGPDSLFAYTVTVRVPTLAAATVGDVGDAVAAGWFETLERRLEDAPQATRADVQLETFDVERDGDDIYVTFGFEWADPDRAVDIAKTLIEYVEGTYVEGVVPGYEYGSPVDSLIASASHDSGGGGTPL
jgi:hypothetical protein